MESYVKKYLNEFQSNNFLQTLPKKTTKKHENRWKNVDCIFVSRFKNSKTWIELFQRYFFSAHTAAVPGFVSFKLKVSSTGKNPGTRIFSFKLEVSRTRRIFRSKQKSPISGKILIQEQGIFRSNSESLSSIEKFFG